MRGRCECGSGINKPNETRCFGCRGRRARVDKRDRPTAAERGYNVAHTKLRKQLLDGFQPGDPCARCDAPMLDKSKVDLDHTDDRSAYLGLSHAWCNRSHGRSSQPLRREKVCDGCGLTYLTRWRDQKWCTRACRLAHQVRREPRAKAVSELRQCTECLAMFVAGAGRGRRQVTCSTACCVARNGRTQREGYRLKVGIPLDAPEQRRRRAS